MSNHPKVAIFWDYENCNPPSNSCGLGYDIVNNISRLARLFGSITTFRAYLDISAQSSKSVTLRSELQSSGVSMIDCPHNGRKDVVDKMILVDMLAFAVDHPAPATVILITGDRDYAYAVSILKLRKYQVILVVPSSPHTSPSLESQASLVIDWGAAALRTRTETTNSTQHVRQPYLDLDANLVIKILRELQDPLLDDLDATMHPHSAAFPSTPSLRRITTRDLLEPSRHRRSTRSFDSMQESTPALASPRKSTNAGSDPALEGLPIPETPSRFRRASISTGSTRARNTPMVERSPPAVEQVTLVSSPPMTNARRPITSDITDVLCPTKRSPFVLPSLDTLELPFHDSHPPSSIIVRLPLEPSQPAPAPGNPTVPSSHKLNCLASPFVMPNVPTGLRSIPGSCAEQSHTRTRLTSPIVAATKTLSKTVSSACSTPQIKAIGIPMENEHVTSLRIDDNDTRFGPSIPHPTRSREGTHGTTDTPKSNYDSYVALRTAYPSSNGRVELYLTDTPSSNHTSHPAAIPPVVGDGVDSPSPVLSGASNILRCSAPGSESVPASNAFLSIPFTTTESHERDETGQRQTWIMFKPLIHLLLAARERGITRPSRSTIALELVESDKQVYRRAGVSRFREYTALAEQAGIIELGGKEGGAWIALHHNWFGVDCVTTTHLPSNSVASPTSDPLNAIQSPLLMGSKTPPMEGTTILQLPTFTSPKFRSPENSNMLPTSIDRLDGTPRASIPAQFLPLIDILIRTRAEGSHQTLRSIVGQLLGQDVYARAGVPGFKEYVHRASEAQLVQFGGVGGHAWIRLHPELRI